MPAAWGPAGGRALGPTAQLTQHAPLESTRPCQTPEQPAGPGHGAACGADILQENVFPRTHLRSPNDPPSLDSKPSAKGMPPTFRSWPFISGPLPTPRAQIPESPSSKRKQEGVVQQEVQPPGRTSRTPSEGCAALYHFLPPGLKVGMSGRGARGSKWRSNRGTGTPVPLRRRDREWAHSPHHCFSPGQPAINLGHCPPRLSNRLQVWTESPTAIRYCYTL